MAVTKEEALRGLKTAYEYAITLKGGPNSRMAVEFAVWMQRGWAADGTAAVAAAKRDKAAPVVVQQPTQDGQPRRMATLKHPRAVALGEAKGVAEEPRQGPKAIIRPKGQPAAKVEPPKVDQSKPDRPKATAVLKPEAVQERTGKENPAAVVDAPDRAEALSTEELATLDSRKPRPILMEFGEARIEATLTEVYGVGADDMPNGAMQKAAMLKQKAAGV